MENSKRGGGEKVGKRERKGRCEGDETTEKRNSMGKKLGEDRKNSRKGGKLRKSSGKEH